MFEKLGYTHLPCQTSLTEQGEQHWPTHHLEGGHWRDLGQARLDLFFGFVSLCRGMHRHLQTIVLGTYHLGRVEWATRWPRCIIPLEGLAIVTCKRARQRRDYFGLPNDIVLLVLHRA